MRRLIPFWLLAMVALTTRESVRGDELRPILATVVTPGAAVRSGPAETYYLTDTLPQDTTVEVYRQQPDGWCAIRPPADSFSWVHSRHVRLLGDELAEINKDDTAARVGSRLSLQRDVVQVRLRKGETVKIVGQDERDGDLWYKIAPPPGEFRWVHVKNLASKELIPADNAPSDGVAPASHETTATNAAGQWSPIAAPPLATHDAPPAVANTEPLPTAAAPTPPVDITPIGPGTASSADIARQLMDLELRLSRMVAEPTATWSIQPLEQAAEILLSQADTVADRQAVKATLAKIDRFAAIQRRAGFAPAAPMPMATGTPDGQLANSSSYDAVGVLRPVVSRRPGAPQFALVDDQGQVLTFVTPTPDVNLQPYVGQRIGITGRRGYIPEFRRPHVTAGRITPLTGRMLR